MKNSPKKRPRSAAKSISTSLPLVPVSVVLGGMISTLQGLLGVFERPIDAEVKELIKLATALRDQSCSPSSRPRKRK